MFSSTKIMQALSPAAAAPSSYEISRSLRSNSADTPYLTRTPASASNRKTWTWSGWVKKSKNGEFFTMLQANYSSTPWNVMGFDDTDKFSFDLTAGVSTGWATTAVFRDLSAWYHFVFVLDTTSATSTMNGSATDRIRAYVNGVQLVLSGGTVPTQNADFSINNNIAHYIGGYLVGRYNNGYMTEINFIDGQALTPSSFGETSTTTGVWNPIAYTGTYGTNGFYLNFSDNSGTTSTTLGKDYSPNGNNWTPNNFSVTAGAGNDSLVDTPTNYGTDTGVGGEVRGNYATWDILSASGATGTNGNLDIAAANNALSTPTTFFPTTGKWYCEVVHNSGSSPRIGVTNTAGVGFNLGSTANSWAYLYDGRLFHNNAVGNNTGISVSTGDILMMALDLDAGYLWYGKNGVWMPQTSGGSVGVPSTGSNPTQSFTANQAMSFAVASGGGTPAWTGNWGQRAFAYTAPSGFKALCTQNLPTPTIGATSSTLASAYMLPVLYTGNSSTQTITTGFQPDFVWIKSRSTADVHTLQDVLRGSKYYLISNSTAAEATQADSDGISAFTSTGFTLGYTDSDAWNKSPNTYVSWNWKAGGAGVTNTNGSLTSTVSANTTSGFSIVTYTIPSASATIETFGHGLSATPSMVILKVRGSVDEWTVYNINITTPLSNWLTLNTTAAAGGASSTFSSSSTTFGVRGTRLLGSGTSGNIIAYCFAEVAGFSKFGSYTGNSSSDGPFVYCGFRPRYIMIKGYAVAGAYWIVIDTARDTYNVSVNKLSPNVSDAENSVNLGNTTQNIVDILSNGFKLRSTTGDTNNSSQSYVFAAFAESPFNYARAR
jgi:hypothetical protein